jgi:hypothetical protein
MGKLFTERFVAATIKLAVGWAGGWICTASASVPSGSSIVECGLIADGRPMLPVIVPSEAGADELEAAAEWARVLGKMGRVQPRVRPEPAVDSAAPSPGVYVGGTGPGRALLAQHPPGDPDGFAISVDAGNSTVILVGATPRATCFAVEWFLEHRGGVNWYFPGSLGEVIPMRTDWRVPAGATVQVPAYVSRELAGLRGDDAELWARRNLLEGRFSFHHNLNNVFPSALAEDHPEFFSLRDGARYNPRAAGEKTWQPDFANPAVAAYAARQARQYFDDHPDALSYSLGLNDNTAFDEGPGTRALTEPPRWFRGRPDYSDLVFTFMNRAADDLMPSYPDKYLGCLAYYWCENTPTFPVRPQVLPYLTNDRSFYDNPVWAAQDIALIHRWAQAGPKIIGIYDYYYGAPFAVPRIFTGAMIKSIREAHAVGATAFFAELFPIWEYDSLKAWLAARLLWDPGANTAALEAQFYGDLYGPAAGDVQAFFEEAEAAWREQPGAPRWIKGYNDPYQSLIFSSERVKIMSAELALASQRDLAPAARERLRRLQNAWASSQQAIGAATIEADLADDTASRAWQIENGLRETPAAVTDGAESGFYLRAGEWAEKHFQRDRLSEALAVTADGDSPAALTARSLFAPRGLNLLHNGALRSFAVGRGPDDWDFAWREAEHLRFGPVGNSTPEEKPAFAVSGSDWLGLWQDAPVESGKLYEASFLWRGRISLGSRVHWAIAYYDASGQFLRTSWQAAAPPGDHHAWLREGAVTRAPVSAAKLRLFLYVQGQAAGEEVQLANAEIQAVL